MTAAPARSRATAASRRPAGDVLHGEQLSRGVGVDALRGELLFDGEPVVSEVQVDPGRLDRAVAGLGPDRFERHAGLAQTSEVGVAQLVTGATLEPGAVLGAGDEFVESFQCERPTAPPSVASLASQPSHPPLSELNRGLARPSREATRAKSRVLDQASPELGEQPPQCRTRVYCRLK